MNLFPEQESHLRHLLEHLEKAKPEGEVSWKDWQITSLTGGANNCLFRARNSFVDIVIKFAIRDERNRAEREFYSLLLLEETGLEISPKPLLLDTRTYHQPVVVQTWIEGERISHPPITDEEWQELIRYYIVVHSVILDANTSKIPKAYSASNLTECRTLIDQQLARIPNAEQPTTLQNLVCRFKETEILNWKHASITLCRIDPNVSNFIRCETGLVSVDWEYSGWGDPAFDIADLMTHPTYMDVPASRWDWLIQTYSELSNDSSIAIRIGIYYKTLLVWWVARSARFIYEVSRGLDKRLVSHPPDWKTKTQKQYDHYLKLADKLLDHTH